MKKYLFAVIVVIMMILAVTLSIQAQPAGGAGAGGGMGGGPGGGMGGGMGGGPGGGMGGGMGMGGMGGGMGMGMGMGAPPQRPDKATRLKAIEDIQKQIAALKAAIQKAPDTDPCIAKLTGNDQTKFETQYNEERDAITQIVTSINTIRPTAGGGMMMMMGRGGVSGLTTDQITELTTIAKGEKATKTTAKLEALAKEAEAAANRGGMMGGGMMGGGMMGGGMMGGGMMGGGAPPAGGF